MIEQIVKIEADPIDKGCMKITLKEKPTKLQFWKKQESKLNTYKY